MKKFLILFVLLTATLANAERGPRRRRPPPPRGPMHMQEYIDTANSWNRYGQTLTVSPDGVKRFISGDDTTCGSISIPAGTQVEFIEAFPSYRDYSTIGRPSQYVAYIKIKVFAGTRLTPESWYDLNGSAVYNSTLMVDCIAAEAYYTVTDNYDGVRLPDGYVD